MDINKYYPLAIFLGIICKIYDDLYDNNLYEYLNIQKQYHPLISNVLNKGVHHISSINLNF